MIYVRSAPVSVNSPKRAPQHTHVQEKSAARGNPEPSVLARASVFLPSPTPAAEEAA